MEMTGSAFFSLMITENLVGEAHSRGSWYRVWVAIRRLGFHAELQTLLHADEAKPPACLSAFQIKADA